MDDIDFLELLIRKAASRKQVFEIYDEEPDEDNSFIGVKVFGCAYSDKFLSGCIRKIRTDFAEKFLKELQDSPTQK